MIAAGKQEIRKWFLDGAEQGYEYMLIVYDRMAYPENSDSPYYACNAEEAWKIIKDFRHDELSQIMEVYDLSADMEAQLAEKRAWHIPAPQPPAQPTVYMLPADGLLPSGQTRLQFMEAQNAEFIKEHFGGSANAVAYPTLVFADDAHLFVHNICVYILEQELATKTTAAVVYRFTEDGGAQTYNEVLSTADEDNADDFLFPLTRYHEVDVDDSYVTFELRYATGKDPYSPAYKQWCFSETKVFADDYSYLGMHSISGYPHIDKKSHKLYEQAMELLQNSGCSDQALKLLHQAAEEGHADAMFALGNCYKAAVSSALARDAQKAAYWYKRAALLGHQAAMEKLK